ncbi:MAG: alpha/beta fold hydrolase [Rhizobiaceae bacterium]|nr:alpha/beta fold hydrolase [Rhizobiaceae bacterium]
MGFAGVIAAILAALLVAALLVLGYLLYVSWRIRRRAERLVPPRGKFIEVDGNRIHYVDRGVSSEAGGPPILMVHGLGGTQAHFQPLLSGLAKDFRVIAIDRPGSGYSTRRNDRPGDTREQAAFLVKLIDALGLEKPLVVGHSLGGAITLAMAVDFPQRIAGIVVISPLTQFREDVPPAFAAINIRRPWLRRLIAETISAPNAARMAAATHAFVFAPQQPPADYMVAGGAMLALKPSHFYAASTDFVATRGGDVRAVAARYGEIGIPAGMAFGTADRVIDSEEHGRALAVAMPGLDAVFLEGVGHMPQYSHAAEVEALIRRIAGKAFAGRAA